MASLDWPLTTWFMEEANITLPRWLRSNKNTSLETFSMTKGSFAERTLGWKRTAPSWSTRPSLPRTKSPTFRSIRNAGHDIPFALRRRSASWEHFLVPLLGWRRNPTRSSRTSASNSTSYANTTSQRLGRGQLTSARNSPPCGFRKSSHANQAEEPTSGHHNRCILGKCYTATVPRGINLGFLGRATTLLGSSPSNSTEHLVPSCCCCRSRSSCFSTKTKNLHDLHEVGRTVHRWLDQKWLDQKFQGCGMGWLHNVPKTKLRMISRWSRSPTGNPPVSKGKTGNILSAECHAMVLGVGSVHWHRFLLLEALGHQLNRTVHTGKLNWQQFCT